MNRITIKTLAQQLGLSIATVSKALKDSYEISAETKSRVLLLAKDLNYVPNPYASSLRKQQSNTIAVILPDVADNFFSLAIQGIHSIAVAKNYHVLIYLSHESFEVESKALQHCSSGRVDGVLVSVSNETTNTEHFEKLKKENIPLVFFDRNIEKFPVPKVITNDYECGETAAKTLVAQGCKNPVFFSTSESLSICTKRYSGFISAVAKMGLSVNDRQFIINCNNNNKSITSQIQCILNKRPHIDGIVASVEKLAIHTYQVCHNIGVKIPEDLKVIAFSTLETASILNPSLTTICQPAFDIGWGAAEILFSMIEKKREIRQEDFTLILPSSLIERDSTRSTHQRETKLLHTLQNDQSVGQSNHGERIFFTTEMSRRLMNEL